MDYSKIYKSYDSDGEFEQAKGRKTKGKKYVLVEFPYPSGTGLHIGHAFSFTAADVYARFCRAMGYNVLFPMGWDAFGLPTENFAIKSKRKPQEITREFTAKFKEQMDLLGMSFEWERELATTDPQFYKWTQWIFIKLWEKGLAEKQKMPINWCPSCKIGLANEEVVDGKCERCGSEVEKRDIEQWVVKITQYADRLAEGLEHTDFIEKVKSSQINWIGKKSGAKIRFGDIEVFTTRPDTIYGVSALVVAPEHPIVLNQILQSSQPLREASGLKIDSATIQEVKKYVESVKNKSDLERTDLNKDKSGVFTGLYVENPVNGKKVPVWVADYVLNSFGTGAIMLVPAHDQRDYDFAKKYGLEKLQVVKPLGTQGEETSPLQETVSLQMAFEDEGVSVNSELFDGQKTAEAKKTIIKWLVDRGVGEEHTTFHLRDWIFSRQHYWGEPVPMWREIDGGWQPVPESELPVVLPEVEAYEPTDDGKSPLSKIDSFVKYKDGERDTDTMPNWAGSDWYFLGYLMKDVWSASAIATADKSNVFVKNADKIKYWMPVDVYIGGDEHNTLHLLYSRFIYQFLYDLGMVPTPEPYFRRVSHGVILAPDGRRMSKSKGNTVDPIPLCEEFGSDVIRMSMMFMGPFDATMPWNPNTVAGVKRFLEKFKRMIERVGVGSSDPIRGEETSPLQSILHKTIRDITRDLGQCKFNTPIAKLMEFVNSVNESNSGSVDLESAKKLVILLAPYAPFTAEELWKQLGQKDSVHEQLFPDYNSSLIVSDTINVPVCINGKVRDQLELAVEEADSQEMVVAKAMKLAKISKDFELKSIKKIVYVKGKMLNLVV